MPTSQLPKFGKPPVTEVVCGIYFENLDALQVPLVGRLWERLKHDFPRAETKPTLPPTISASGPSDMFIQLQFGAAEPSPFPRIWFVSEDDSSLVQLQRDRLIINWRRRDADARYPSYDIISTKLREVVDIFSDFTKEENIGTLITIGLEIGYVNTLLYGHELAGPEDVGTVIPMLAWRPKGEAPRFPVTGLGWNADLGLPGGGSLSVTLNTTHRPSDGRGVARLDLLARKFSPNLATSAIWEWFDLAHEAIVTTFADITDAGVQHEVWGREK
ncbi:TIGR04255 family protein [Methylobacterium tarhaniae]|uniref:TIGR04255 family protein n=1 Tax=Methylobacterium tarhaniae TaxID=1187852 RepID=UPI000A93C8CC|nr:TIGR04255 family protein [Methylobacterium tarhaniae]